MAAVVAVVVGTGGGAPVARADQVEVGVLDFSTVATQQSNRWLPIGLNDAGAMSAIGWIAGASGGVYRLASGELVDLQKADTDRFPPGSIQLSSGMSASGVVAGRHLVSATGGGQVPWRYHPSTGRVPLPRAGYLYGGVSGVGADGTVFGSVGTGQKTGGVRAAVWPSPYDTAVLLGPMGSYVTDVNRTGAAVGMSEGHVVVWDIASGASTDLSVPYGLSSLPSPTPYIDDAGRVVVYQNLSGYEYAKAALVDPTAGTVQWLWGPFGGSNLDVSDGGWAAWRALDSPSTGHIEVMNLATGERTSLPVGTTSVGWPSVNDRGQVAYSVRTETIEAMLWDPHAGAISLGDGDGLGLMPAVSNNVGDLAGLHDTAIDGPTSRQPWIGRVRLGPQPPEDVTGHAEPGLDQSVVEWSPPASNGDAPVDEYRVFLSGQPVGSVDGDDLAYVQPQHAGGEYRVSAVNEFGESRPSEPVVVSTPGYRFHSMSPVRVLDSRPGSQVGAFSSPWGAGVARTVPVAGLGGVPVGASAVVLNVTATGGSASSHLTVWPSGSPRPLASSLNWSAGQTVPNAVTAPVGAGGSIDVFNAAGSVDVVIDVVGWYDDQIDGLGLHPRSPVRVLDSRPGSQVGAFSSPWGAGVARTVPVAGLGGVPVGASAVVLNVTATGGSASSHLTVWPSGSPRPLASSLNWSAGQTVPNAVTAPVGAGGSIDVFNAAGSVDVVIDVVGWYDDQIDGLLFHPVTPMRILDSRPGSPVGPFATPWPAWVARTVPASSGGGIPPEAEVLQANITVTGGSAASHLTAWPAGQPAPVASLVNWVAGQTRANAMTMPIGAGSAIALANNAGSVDVIADTSGWFGAS